MSTFYDFEKNKCIKKKFSVFAFLQDNLNDFFEDIPMENSFTALKLHLLALFSYTELRNEDNSTTPQLDPHLAVLPDPQQATQLDPKLAVQLDPLQTVQLNQIQAQGCQVVLYGTK